MFTSSKSAEQARINELERQITKLEIDRAQIVEKNEREIREVKHMVGLEKQRQAVEIEQAKKDATLAVREENLKSDKAAFDREMQFREKRFTEEVGYLKDLMGQILDRLPHVSVDKRVGK